MLTATEFLMALSDGAILAASDDGDSSNFALLFLLSGFVFYGYVFLRYRNAGKRHKHEQETQAHLHDIQAVDRFIRTRTGLSNSTMSGANNNEVRGSLNQLTGGITGSIKKFLE